MMDINGKKKAGQGDVYWITGLAGAGKTTIAGCLYQKMKEKNDGIVLLDGDELRKTVAGDLGYTEEERFQAAMRYAKLCAMLARQGITVVIGTISMFHKVREWNRKNIPNYCEVYLRVPIPVLESRNQKSLYSNVKTGGIKNVVGMDMVIEEPKNPDLVIDNDGSLTVEECVRKIQGWSKNGN